MTQTRNSRKATENPSPFEELPAPTRHRRNTMPSISEVRANSPLGDEDYTEPSEPRHKAEEPDESRPATPRGSHTAPIRDSPENLFRPPRSGSHVSAAMAEEVRRMIREEARSTRPPSPTRSTIKVRKPDPFDGSDPHKLQTFLTQLSIVFRSDRRSYANDETKVLYAISYLKGTALAWFEPDLHDHRKDPDWLGDYDLFVETLEKNFGVLNSQGHAVLRLERLRMDSGQNCLKYLTEFARLAPLTGWNDTALNNQLYKGLPERLKNAITNGGKPTTVAGMRAAIQKYDHRYWERQEEIRDERSSKPAGKTSSSSKSGSSSNNSGSSNSASTSSGSNSNNKSSSKPSNSGSGKGSSQSSKSNSGNKAKSDPKLGNDGKLTQEERQRRIDNKLCLFCGGPGHMPKDCPSPKSSASQAKARAANTSNSGTPGSAKA